MLIVTDIPGQSGVVDHETLDLVGDVLEPVHHLFQMTVDFAADDERHRAGIALILEQRLEARFVDLFRMAFDPHQPFGQGVNDHYFYPANGAAESLRW